MGDLLRVYNIFPYIEAFRKMAGQYYTDKIDVCKNAVSMPGISVTYVLKKFSGKKTKSLSYIQQGTLVTYFEINEKSSGTVVVMP